MTTPIDQAQRLLGAAGLGDQVVIVQASEIAEMKAEIRQLRSLNRRDALDLQIETEAQHYRAMALAGWIDERELARTGP